MTKLNFIDLQILYLGIKKEGKFDEKDIEGSDLKNLGVGRTLDQLASLKERNLIQVSEDRSFLVTKHARHILWDDQIPLWIKILRILEIKSQDIKKIASFLLLLPEHIEPEIEDLRKKQLVLMSPLRKETGIVKMYEIMQEGIELIAKAQTEGFHSKPKVGKSQIEILAIIEETVQEINRLQGISDIEKEKIVSNLLQIKDNLEI